MEPMVFLAFRYFSGPRNPGFKQNAYKMISFLSILILLVSQGSQKNIFSLIFSSNERKNVLNQFLCTFWVFGASLELKE